MLSTLVMLVIYLHYKPLEDPRAQKMEIFNELTMLTLLYILVFYTELTDGEYSFRSNLGLLSVFLTLANFGLHITLLLAHSCQTVKRLVKRKCFSMN